MDIDDTLQVIHDHLDQSFDKVSIDYTDKYGDLTITAIKGGKVATHIVSTSDFDNDYEDDEDYDEINHEEIKEVLDNIKYELLKNVI